MGNRWRSPSWRNNQWANINSVEDVEYILDNISDGINYVNGLCGEGKAYIEDTEDILEGFERFKLGIRKLEVCKIATKEEIEELIKRKDKYNEDLKWLNTRIMCCRD
jgi:radical SAM superfamily enzyme with C-terminal helix-hairpin-helix motif